MKKKIYLLIILTFVIAFSLILGFVLDTIESMQIQSEGYGLILYWISKSLVLVILLASGLYIAFKKQDAGNIVILLKLALAIQLLPLIMRLFLMGDEPRLIWAVIVSFVTFIAFFSTVFGLDILNDTINKKAPVLEGKTIEVVDEVSYFDKDGRFKGSQDKQDVNHD